MGDNSCAFSGVLGAVFFATVFFSVAFFTVFVVAGFLADVPTAFFAAFAVEEAFFALSGNGSVGCSAVSFALAFQPKRFSFPTTAFLETPKRLPISDVDSFFAINAFNFFNIALSQPVLIFCKTFVILLYFVLYHTFESKGKGENVFFYIFFYVLLAGALWCAYQISVADFRRRIIPDVYLWPLMIIGFVLINFFPWVVTVSDAIIGAAFGYVISLLIGYLFEKRAQKKSGDKYEIPIGLGDVKLLAVAGVWLGTRGLAIALVFAYAFAFVWARRRNQKFVPFAPFMILGGILALIIMAFLI